MIELQPLLDVVRDFERNLPLRWCGIAEEFLGKQFGVNFKPREAERAVEDCGCSSCLEIFEKTPGVPGRFTLSEDSRRFVTRSEVLTAILMFRYHVGMVQTSVLRGRIEALIS